MSVKKTKRQRIIDAVVARMRTISVANGFQTDAGAKVFEWAARMDEGEIDALPSKVALSVCDLPAEGSKESKQSKGSTYRMRIQVRILKGRGTDPAALRAVLGDVVDAVGRDVTQADLDPLLWPEAANGGKYLAMDTEPGDEGFVLPTEAMEIKGGAVEFTIVFATAVFDPYQ
jgi:hypothetical protein